MLCLKHSDRDAVTVCAACGKPLCEECIGEKAEDRCYCSASCMEKGEASRLRSVEVISSAGRVDRKSRLRTIIWLIILLAIACGAWFYYRQNEKKVNSWFSGKAEQIRETAADAVEEGKANMPKDSKYKREREKLIDQQ